jgi:hypothetical protein
MTIFSLYVEFMATASDPDAQFQCRQPLTVQSMASMALLAILWGCRFR